MTDSSTNPPTSEVWARHKETGLVGKVVGFRAQADSSPGVLEVEYGVEVYAVEPSQWEFLSSRP